MSGFLGSTWRRFVISVPYVWLFLLFLVPFLIVLKISFADPATAQPPFTPLFDPGQTGFGGLFITGDNYRYLVQDNLYWLGYLKSLKIALISTGLCLLIGYPMAYVIARSDSNIRYLLLLLVVVPFWTSFLLRVYAWIGLLQTGGLVNDSLMAMGIIEQPLKLLYTDFAVYLGIIYSYLPFMILPLYASLERLDIRLEEAAADLGASPLRIFTDVTLPLSVPGIVAGCLLVFIPALGEFVIPSLLGGLDSLMIGRQLYEEFFGNRDWPAASAVAVILLLILVLPIVLFQRTRVQEGG